MSSTLEIRAILRDEFSASVEKMKAEILSLGTTATTAGDAMRQGMSSVLPTMESVNESLGRNVAQLRAQAAAYKSAEGQEYLASQKALRAEIDQLTQSGEKQGVTWANIASKYYLVSQAAGIAGNVMGSLVDAASKYEMIRARLNAAERSESLGGKDFETIQELAKKPGLGFEQAASTFATLRGMKVTATEATKLINGIAAANSSAAGTAEQFGGVMYQIQQSVSLGRLMAEDLRPIMQQIPTLGAAIQESFGASQAEQLNDRLKESGMNVRDFWLKVADLGKNLPATGETISNNLDNMGDAWVRFRAALTNTEAIKNATGALASFVETAAKALESSSKENALRKKAEKSLGIRTTKTNALTDVGFAEGAADEAKIQAEMIRLRQEEVWSAMNEEYDKAEHEDQERWDKQVKKDLDAWEQKQKEKRDKFQKKWDEDRAQERADAMNRSEQERVNHEAELRQKDAGYALRGDGKAQTSILGRKNALGHEYGQSSGIRMSDAMLKADKIATDKYYDDKEKAEADYKKQFNASQKIAFAAYKLDEEKKTKITEDEWKARSDMARSYAETLSSTMESAYTDILVNGRDVFASLYDAFSEMITKMAIEMAAKATIFGALSLIPGMGGATGLLGGAGSFIFGARASGGAVFPGMTYRKNEDAYGGGGEPFRPSTAGTIMPDRSSTGTGPDGAVHYHFAAGTSRADAGYIVRALQQGTKERRRPVSRGL